MKKILIIFLLSLISNISSAQSGWGYVNYTSYKTHNGNGSQNQYTPFADNAAGFDAMFNTANSNTTIYATGETKIVNLYNGSLVVPRWSGDFYGYKFEFWFVPTETGTYWFGTNSDDASDILIDGVVVASYYGGHGAGGYQTGSKSMVAGQRYRMVYRGQEFGGGDVFYFQWAKPSAPNTYFYWNNEVTNIETIPSKQVKMNFDFGSTLDKTKFSVGGKTLSSLGGVDVTNSIDTVIISGGYKSNVVGGEVEWSYITNYTNENMLLYIDLRTFNNILPSNVKSIKLLNVYEGPITYSNTDPYWAVYVIPKQTFTPGTYVRDMGAGSYAFKCNITYSNLEVYKPQSVTITTTNNLSTLYNSIITVSDVWLAFKEVSNNGIFGNEIGKEFTYGIQYKNADVNDDGYFNEADAFRLLQHLTGNKNIVDSFTLTNTLKAIPTTNYNNIGKTNWNTSPSYLGSVYNFDINTGKSIDSINISGTWKGDVNLSHSSIPTSNGITTMSVRNMSLVGNSDINEVNAIIMGEIIGNTVIITLSVNPLQQELVGTQFQLNYDNTKLKFEKVVFTTKGNSTNFGTDKGSFINIGSLLTTGDILDKTTEYKVIFSPINNITDILGLTSISTTEAINKSGKQLKIKLN